jgi:GMP synthase (glutamine-hydrolysing)
MREQEPDQVVGAFQKLGVLVEIVDARAEFFAALKGVTDPEAKRESITQTFYRNVFGRIVRESGAKCLLQGTILTDVDETVAGIKRQHNVFAQLGIDPQEAFGYHIVEPLIQLRKDGVRRVGKALGLPDEISERIPFPGPALSARVIGEATPERIETVRKATAVVERLLGGTGAFQYLAILHEDRVTGMRDGKRDFGQQIEVRCWDSVDARTATPTRLSSEILEKLALEVIREVPDIVSVTYNMAPKPPSAKASLDDRGDLTSQARQDSLRWQTRPSAESLAPEDSGGAREHRWASVPHLDPRRPSLRVVWVSAQIGGK